MAVRPHPTSQGQGGAGPLGTMRLDERLNLVLPLEGGRGFVHCQPLDRDVFRHNWRLFAETWSMMENDNLSITAAGAVAAMAMEERAQALGCEEQHAAIMAEIGRTARLIAPGPEGYAPLPLATAEKRGLLPADEADEVRNALVFFTVSSAVQPRARQMRTFQLLCLCRAAESTSLGVTAFAASLPTSTEDVRSGVTAAA
ncbi:hypothetical protein E3E12_08085 [Formicincola oecophyllae]|uniref:Uncharacterized protein n=1 Tax=Formicincola oecophyllae TaxID=2558361 RepID=A0A4Y6UDQ6_9PROT|nr:hypothetical protein [Formicincola oecophyllae]QDH14155.1 hypothetical protein E3E12_08085 [Formicincola oecophyllae]